MNHADALALWREKMMSFGRTHAEATIAAAALWKAGKGDENTFGITYYDRARVFYQLSDLTGDPIFLEAADAATFLYHFTYLFPGGYGAPGFWVFPDGLAAHFRRTGDPNSKNAVLQLSERAAFAEDLDAVGKGHYLRHAGMARESAYALRCQLVAEDLGKPHEAKADHRLRDTLGHFGQWFFEAVAPVRPQPFVVGLASEALIDQHTRTGDARILPVLRAAAAGLMATHWREDQSFTYIYEDGTAEHGSHDLSLLISPLYAWLYHQTGETQFRDWHDAIFAGGVEKGYWQGEKQFNQLARWSPAGVEWRDAKPLRKPLPRAFIVTADAPMKFEVRIAGDGTLTTASLPYVPRPKPI